MSSHLKFVPESIEAFKHAARDLQRCYPLSLQKSQEVLARVYGYSDLHALQEHLKLSPQPGVQRKKNTEFQTTYIAESQGFTTFNELTNGAVPVGRLSFMELELFSGGDVRKEAMDFEKLVDSEILGVAPVVDMRSTADYVYFEVQDVAGFTANYSLKNFHEGVFRLTRLGRVVYDAISYLIEEMEAVHEDSLWQENYEKILGIAERHPSNPYVQSKLLDLICRHSESMMLENGEDGSALALATLRTCRTQFESLMPKGFRHQIEPNLTGGNAANYEYFSCLYNGANIADSLGNRRTALAWARHSMRLHKNDSFGFRFIFEELVK